MGRHSKPDTHSSTGPLVAVAIATSSAFASVPLAAGVADAATVKTHAVAPSDDNGGGWDSVSGAIAQCESGGNPRARNPNPSSSASGAWQLVRGTWASVGGLLFAPSAAQATLDQQETAARRLFERDGLNPWAASRSCWRHKIGMRVGGPRAMQVVPQPRRVRGRHRVVMTPPPVQTPRNNRYAIRRGDTLSAIAVANGHTWQELFAENRAVLANPDLLRVGQIINLP